MDNLDFDLREITLEHVNITSVQGYTKTESHLELTEKVKQEILSNIIKEIEKSMSYHECDEDTGEKNNAYFVLLKLKEKIEKHASFTL